MQNIYKIKNTCRLCNSKKLKKGFDLGMNPIGNDYTRKPNNCLLIPLEILCCTDCGFKQLSTVVNQDKVYLKFLYTTKISKGLVDHFKKGFKFILKQKLIKEGDFVLDIGSNDGSNLNIFKKNKFNILGIEPAKNLAKLANRNGIKTLNEFFSKNTVTKILKTKKKPNLICIYNTMANIDNLNEFMKNLLLLVSKDTYISIESFSLYGIVKHNLFDNIYHEHLSYFHVENLQKYFKKFGLYVIYAENNKIKGGSIKLILSKKNKFSKSVQKVIRDEQKLKLNSSEIFSHLIKKNYKLKINLANLLNKFGNKTIGGYGASVGSTALIHYYSITNKLKLLYDDDKIKNNLYSPSTNIKVVNPNLNNLKKVDVIIIIAWRYKKNIIKVFNKKFKSLKNKIKLYQILPNIKKIKF